MGRTRLSRELQRGAEGLATVAEQGLVLPALIALAQQPGLQPPRHPENSVQSAKLVLTDDSNSVQPAKLVSGYIAAEMGNSSE